MIHLIIREPVPYQLVLCRELHKAYPGQFVAWFGEQPGADLPYAKKPGGEFTARYLDRDGYGSLIRALLNDRAAVLIVGGWWGRMAAATLAIAFALRLSVFVWVDHPHPKKRTTFFDVLRKGYLRILDKIVSGFLACGRPTVEHLASIGLKNRNIVCFPYWVDLPNDWSLPNSVTHCDTSLPLRLLAVGRLTAVKRFDTVIRALARVNEKSKLAELVLVGDGPERSALESLCRQLRCLESVEYKGWLQAEQVLEEIARSDLVVITSAFEGYGVVALEAMGAGRMVLASNGVTAARDRDDGSGAILLHPVGDFEHLAMQIHNLFTSREQIGRGCRSARRIAEEWPLARALSILHQVLLNTKRGRMLDVPHDSEVHHIVQG